MSLSVNWKELEDLVDEAINDDMPYLAFKIIEKEECKYIKNVAEGKLLELSNKITVIIFLISVGLSLATPFIFAKRLDEFGPFNKSLISIITIAILAVVICLVKIIRLSTTFGIVRGIITAIIIFFGFLSIVLIFNRGLSESIGFFVGIIVLIFCVLYVWKIWKPKYNTCNKFILNAERKILQMERVIKDQ